MVCVCLALALSLAFSEGSTHSTSSEHSARCALSLLRSLSLPGMKTRRKNEFSLAFVLLLAHSARRDLFICSNVASRKYSAPFCFNHSHERQRQTPPDEPIGQGATRGRD